MGSRIATGFTLAVIAATLSACVPSNATQAPRPVTPEEGPTGTVHVDYIGGSYTRQIRTRFRVDRDAFVLVGHLGGDGVIRVLYPETPSDRGRVAGGKAVAIKSQTAAYDVSPHLFSFATAPYRSFSAQMDSYDGLGHGYVFMIASRYPIDYDALATRDGFEMLEIEDYETTRDPRYAIRNLADELATGGYTLKFARNPHGGAYALSTGCPSRWGLMSYRPMFGYAPWMDLGYSFFTYPGASLLNGVQFARYYSGGWSCRGSMYASGRHFFRGVGRTVVIPATGTPQGPLTPRLQRPTRRTLDDEQRTVIISGRSAIDRTGTVSTRRSFDGRRRSSRPSVGAADRSREIDRSRPTRASQPPRASTPAATGSSSGSSGSSGSSNGGTKAPRPRPRP